MTDTGLLKPLLAHAEPIEDRKLDSAGLERADLAPLSDVSASNTVENSDEKDWAVSFASASTDTSSSTGGPDCRICGERDGKLYSCCACIGSIELVHEHCLQQWIRSRPVYSLDCEICRSPYRLRVRHVCTGRCVGCSRRPGACRHLLIQLALVGCMAVTLECLLLIGHYLSDSSKPGFSIFPQLDSYMGLMMLGVGIGCSVLILQTVRYMYVEGFIRCSELCCMEPRICIDGTPVERGR